MQAKSIIKKDQKAEMSTAGTGFQKEAACRPVSQTYPAKEECGMQDSAPAA